MSSMVAIACDGMRFALSKLASVHAHYVVRYDAGRAVAIDTLSDRSVPRSFRTPIAIYAAANDLNRGGDKS